MERTPKKVGFQLQRPFFRSKTGLDTKSGVDLEPGMREESACTSFKNIFLTFFLLELPNPHPPIWPPASSGLARFAKPYVHQYFWRSCTFIFLWTVSMTFAAQNDGFQGKGKLFQA